MCDETSSVNDDDCEIALLEVCDGDNPEADNDWSKPDVLALAFTLRGGQLLNRHGARWVAAPFGGHRRRAFLPRTKIAALEADARELGVIVGVGWADRYTEIIEVMEWTIPRAADVLAVETRDDESHPRNS